MFLPGFWRTRDASSHVWFTWFFTHLFCTLCHIEWNLLGRWWIDFSPRPAATWFLIIASCMKIWLLQVLNITKRNPKTCKWIILAIGSSLPKNLTTPNGFNRKQVLFEQKEHPFRGHGRLWSRPQRQRQPQAAVGPLRRGQNKLPSAATWSLGAPAGGGWRWRFSKLHGEVFFSDPKRCQSDGWETPSYITFVSESADSELGVAIHTFIHALAHCLGLKLGQTLLPDSECTLKIHFWTYGTKLSQGISTRETDEQGLWRGGPKTVSFLNQIRL